MTERTTSAGSLSSDIIRVTVEPQTYKNIIYLVLAFPLGMFYFVILTVGVALGIGLVVLLVGVPLLLATVIGSRYLTTFERMLANALLDATVSAPDDVILLSANSLLPRLESYLRAESTWKGFAFLYLKFFIGVFSFVMIIVTFSVTMAFLTAPVHYNNPAIAASGVWTINTLPEAIIAVPIGISIGIISLHLVNAIARVSGWIAVALLGTGGN